MKRVLFFIIFYFIKISIVFAQTDKDDLISQINQLKHNFSKYYYNSTDSVLYIIDHSLQEFKKNNLAKAWKYHLKGTYYYRRQIADSALFYYDRCLSVATPQKETFLYNESKIMSSLVLNNIGKPGEALKKLNEAKASLNSIDDVNPFYTINLNRAFGAYYGTIHNNQKSIKNYLKAIKMLEKNYQKTDKQKMKIKANLYINIGDIFFREQHFEKAKSYFEKSLSTCQDINFKYGIMQNKLQVAESNYALGLTNQISSDSLSVIQKYFSKKNIILLDTRINTLLGDLHFDKKNYDDAQKDYLSAYNLSLTHHYVKGIEQLLFKLGESAYLTHKYKLARKYFNDCLNTAQKSKNLDLEMNCYNYLAHIFEKEKQYQQANNCYKKVLTINDSLQTTSQNEIIQELEAKYQNEKNEKQIALLESKNKLVKEQKNNQFKLLTLGGIALFVSGVLLFFVYKNNQKRKHYKAQRAIANQLLASQMEALRARMNPHFLFNSLNSIKSYMISNKPDEAGRYLSKFARLVRQTLYHSKEKLISLKEEIETVNSYLEVEKMRLKDHFDYQININNNIDTNEVFIPPLLIQPFAENAIWHGFSGLQVKGQLNINIYAKKKYVIVEITDNGVGRNQAEQQKNKQHQSLSSNLINQTIEAFKKEGLLNIDIKIIDLFTDKSKPSGTKVVIKILENLV